MIRRNYYDQATDTEMANWPGVRFTREQRGKHRRLWLTVGNVTRFVIYPTTPSEQRGTLNHVSILRRMLAQMGAVRVGSRKTTRRAA